MTPRLRRRDERGYAALLVAILFPVVFIACAALSVDTARWYLEAQRVQAAADAAALGGVVWMPGDFATAKLTATTQARRDGYSSNNATVAIDPGEKSSQLKVTISTTVHNFFGAGIGSPDTVITRSATADYAGGLSMGSPCNEFGFDPDFGAHRSANCGPLDKADPNKDSFWANVGGPQSNKGSGDAFQDGKCNGSEGCAGTTNLDYDGNGYFYTVTFSQAVSNAQIQVFDPDLIDVGDACNENLSGAANIAPYPEVGDPATRYATGRTGDKNPSDPTGPPLVRPYCTGDVSYDNSHIASGYNNQVNTRFSVHVMDEKSDPARPWTWPLVDATSCSGAKVYRGYNGPLSPVLDPSQTATYDLSLAQTFRRWVNLCSFGSVPKGSVYAIQVKTNGEADDLAAGHNRFALRAFSSSASDDNSIAVAAFNKMAVYANVAGGKSTFFLTRIPSTTAGQVLTVKLFDIGDLGTGGTGNLTFIAPSGNPFSNCRAVFIGITSDVPNCQVAVDSTSNNRWKTVYIPIPSDYACTDTDPTDCWVKLDYDFNGATNPADTTSWQATVDGQPVRLIQ